MEAEKPVYRAFFVTPDNHISKASILQAEIDEQAIKAARPMVDGHAIEVWERKRFVIRLKPEPKR